MSLVFRVKNADYSNSGLPKLEQTVLGFPATGLQGLYLFESGVADNLNAGPFVDSSGMGNHGQKFSDFASPLQRSYGLEITDQDGLIIDTGIPQGQDFTVIACLNNTIDTETVDGYPAWFGDTGNDVPSSKADTTGGNSPRLAPNVQLTGSQNTNGLYSANGLMITSPGNRVTINEAAYGSGSEPGILALSVNAAGELKYQTYSGFSFETTDADIPVGYAGLNETMLVGLWPHQAYRPVTGKLYGFAVYNKGLDNDQLSKAMSAMYQRVSARGVTIVS